MKRKWLGYALMLVLLGILVGPPRPGGVGAQEPSALDGWLTQTDPTYGYTVSYPPGWEVQLVFENAKGEPYIIRRRVALQDQQGAPIEIDVWLRDANISLDQWFREVENITDPLESNAIISGQEAFVLVQTGGCGAPAAFSAYVPFGDRIFKIHYQYAGDRRSLDVYESVLRSFSLAGVEPRVQRQTTLPELQAMVPATCGTNICPSTCSGGCTFAPIGEGCCGYHAVPKWQCARECIGDQIGEFQGNCVWWGAYTRRDVGALATGNAENWATSVRNTGQLPIDSTPKVGDIVVHPGSSDNHVAYVVWVAPDGASYGMSDMGWCSDCGPSPEEIKIRSVDGNDEFIHCAGDPAIPMVDWQFTDCPFGWAPSNGFSQSGLTGAAWIFNPADDPFLLSPVVSVSASLYDSIEIEMAHIADSATGWLYFTTASSPDFDENKAVSFATINDGTWREYVVDMSVNPHWQGIITRIRLDPVEAGNGDGSYDDIGITRIRFVNTVPIPFDQRIHLPLALRNYTPPPENRPPHTPSQPSPADGAINQPSSLTLTWLGGDPDGDAVTYDVYFDAGDSTPETLVCGDAFAAGCDPGTLLSDTQYYWQVVATDPHSATAAGPVWEFTTAPTSCVEAIGNGGFETHTDWEIPATSYPAAYSTAEAHTDNRSMRVGIVDPADNVYSYSSVRQLVSIPVDAASATLRYWLYTISGEPGTLAPPPPVNAFSEAVTQDGDAQYVLVLNKNNALLDTLWWQLADDQEWLYFEADLSAYAGRTIKLQFGVKNDGEGGATGMYVDDVSLLVCSP